MKIKQSSKSSLFLIELIIAIFFFIIAATICIQLFVKSHIISNETVSLNHAVLWTQNLAEIFTNQNGDYQLLKELYSQNDCISETSLQPNHHMLLLFDADWAETTDIANTSYYILSVYSENESFHYQDIYVMHYSSSTADFSITDTLAESTALIHYQHIQQFVPSNL